MKKPIASLFGAVAGLAMVMLGSSCAALRPLQTYPGLPQPREKVAHIASFYGVIPHMIDGVRIKGDWQYAEVLPGNHEFRVSYRKEGGYGLSNYVVNTVTAGQATDFTFCAEAGKAYIIWPILQKNTWYPVVESITDAEFDLWLNEPYPQANSPIEPHLAAVQSGRVPTVPLSILRTVGGR